MHEGESQPRCLAATTTPIQNTSTSATSENKGSKSTLSDNPDNCSQAEKHSSHSDSKSHIPFPSCPSHETSPSHLKIKPPNQSKHRQQTHTPQILYNLTNPPSLTSLKFRKTLTGTKQHRTRLPRSQPQNSSDTVPPFQIQTSHVEETQSSSGTQCTTPKP